MGSKKTRNRYSAIERVISGKLSKTPWVTTTNRKVAEELGFFWKTTLIPKQIPFYVANMFGRRLPFLHTYYCGDHIAADIFFRTFSTGYKEREEDQWT